MQESKKEIHRSLEDIEMRMQKVKKIIKSNDYIGMPTIKKQASKT
jgi:hypothetical protein